MQLVNVYASDVNVTFQEHCVIFDIGGVVCVSACVCVHIGYLLNIISIETACS